MAWKILDLLLPREVEFFKLMGQQTDILVHCANTFDRFINDIHRLSEEEVLARLKELKDIETEGDEVERKIIEKLHVSFITPIDREDIHSMVTGFDNAIDAINGSAKKIEVYGLRQIPENVFKLSKIIIKASKDVHELIVHLEKKNSVARMTEIIEGVHTLEKQADLIFHECMADLFRNEKDAGRMIMSKEVYERLEETTDLLDHIAKIIRGVAVKQG